MSEQKKRAGWQPGVSGNPKGRKPGTSDVAKLRAVIAKAVPQIVERLLGKALDGDIGAARLLLERTIAPLKASEATVPLQLSQGSLTDQGHAVLAAVASGQLAPGQAAQLLTGLGSMARLIETDELTRRIAALEDASDDKAR